MAGTKENGNTAGTTVSTGEHGDTITRETGEDTVITKVSGPQFYTVKLTHPSHHGRIVFRSVSRKRAENWLVSRCPRGSEFHLETPGGETHHYEAERAGERGTDANPWMPFDPSTWVPVEAQSPPGQDAWSDREG